MPSDRARASMERRVAVLLLVAAGLAGCVDSKDFESAGVVDATTSDPGPLTDAASSLDVAPALDPGLPTDPGAADPGALDPGAPDPGAADPGLLDPGTPDPGTPDPGLPDSGAPDPGPPDPGPPDPGTPDPGPPDPGTPDPGPSDPGTPDPGTPDPGPPDPGTPDPGPPDPGEPDAGGGELLDGGWMAFEGSTDEFYLELDQTGTLVAGSVGSAPGDYFSSFGDGTFQNDVLTFQYPISDYFISVQLTFYANPDRLTGVVDNPYRSPFNVTFYRYP